MNLIVKCNQIQIPNFKQRIDFHKDITIVNYKKK